MRNERAVMRRVVAAAASAAVAVLAAGLLTPVQVLTGLYDLGPLNKLLCAAGQRPVSS